MQSTLTVKLIFIYITVLKITSLNTYAQFPFNDKPKHSSRLDSNLDLDEPTSYFRSINSFNGLLTTDQYIRYAMRALKQVVGFDNDIHRYDSKSDLIRSFKRNLSYIDNLSKLRPSVHLAERQLLDDENELTQIENEQNQAACGLHLDELVKELRQLLSSSNAFSNSRKLAILELFDSFGSPESQLMKGNLMWLGSYEQCMQNQLNLTSSPVTISTRYCVASFKAPNWSLKLGQVIKLGVCLPNPCNSISIFRHKEKIETLTKLARINQIPYSNFQLTRLYCLPDESSPLRKFSFSAKLFLLIISCWFLIVAYYSLKFECIRICWLLEDPNTRESLDNRLDNLIRIFAFRLNCSKLFDSKRQLNQRENSHSTSQIHVISLQDEEQYCNSNHHNKLDSNRKRQVSSSDINSGNLRASNILEAIKSSNLIKNESSLSYSWDQTSRDLVDQVGNKSTAVIVLRGASTTKEQQPASVDLSAVDGVKVLSMIWLISAHTLLFFIRTMANGRDFWSILRDPKFMTVLAGIFPVDTFFTVTGILTAYLKFSKNHGQAMIKVKYWIENFVHRYLRFMPMYLLVFWYTRDVSEYIGEGPLWDYATADTSIRSICKQESIAVPLFFGANFKPIEDHCVKPAWYLANDYQYLLITPIFMILLMKSTVLGYFAICMSVMISLVLQFLTVFYSTEVDDFGVLINFKPMFGSYVLKNLWKLYVLPYNRLPPYLIGIITGHLMYIASTRYSSNNQTQKKAPPYSKTKENTAFQSQNSLVSHSNSCSDILKESGNKKKEKNTSSSSTYFKALKDYLCIRIWIPLVLLISIIYLPMVTKILTYEGRIAKIGTSSIIALMRLLWSIAIARVIYICCTRLMENNPTNRSDSFVIRLLTSPGWKPWSKIGLSALLIQWEIIGYLAQIQSSTPFMTITFLTATILVCIVTTYLAALLIYLTVEFPLSQVEQLYIHPTIFHKT